MPSHAACQVLSLMDAQAQFFQQGHQSLSELNEYRQKLYDEVIFSIVTTQFHFHIMSQLFHTSTWLWQTREHKKFLSVARLKVLLTGTSVSLTNLLCTLLVKITTNKIR